MPVADFDVAICGAGPAGSALALLLASRSAAPGRIALFGNAGATERPPAADTTAATIADTAAADPRTLALNHGSQQLLSALGAWPADGADILTVHVSQRGRLGRTLIRHDELGVPRLGSVVAYDSLLASLRTRLRQSGVACLPGHPTLHPQAEGVTLTPDQAPPLRAAVAVRADGSAPTDWRRDYGQHAVLATVRASQPAPGLAFERFTRDGPLAVLPHPAGPGLYGIVWCCPPERARALASLPDDGFAAALQAAFGDRLGRLACLPQRHVYPLSLRAGPSLPGPRLAAIGNAAQTLHPVAGQGLNLGLRDAAQLAQALTPWLAQPSGEPSAALARYAEQRRADRWLTAGLTDLLPRVFSTGLPLIEHAGGLSLALLDALPGLRQPLARHLLLGLRR